MLRNIIHSRKDKKTDTNIYNEIARLNLAQRPKICLFSYFTINVQSKSSAETALSFCENDEEKLAYFNNILSLIESSVLSEKFHFTVNDDEMSRPNPEAEEEKFNGADLKKFVQKLNLKQLEQFEPLKDKDIKKFYDFAGPDFTWPSTSNVNERRAIYDYITDPDPRFQEGQGEEIAINRLAYRRLIESGSLDSSKGNYVHIEHGKFVGYGTKLSVEKYMELINKNPGMLYSPIEQEVVSIRFSSTANDNLKEWQVNIRIRKNVDRNDVAVMRNVERDTNNQVFRLIMDSGSTLTIIPYFIRMKMTYDYGWNTIPSSLNGYGSGLDIFKVSIPWEISLGDGSNWTEWIETQELYCWQQKVPTNIDCGVVRFDILNATYQIKIPGRPYIFVTQNDGMNQLQQIYNNY